MVDLAGVGRLHDQAHLGPRPLPHQVVVDGPGEQQRRDRGQLGRGDVWAVACAAAFAVSRLLDRSAELVVSLLGVLKAPIQKFVRTLAEPPAKLARTVAAVRDQKQAAAA